MALAGAGALAIVLLLAASTAVIWLVGRGPVDTTALTGQGPQTPTPRAISFAPVNSDSEIAADSLDGDTVVDIDSTPTLLTSAIEESASGANDLLFEAAAEPDFAPLATASWSGTSPGLVNEGSSAVAERWLLLAAAPAPSVAIEAEIRVSGVLETVCDQSFGITGGSPGSGLVFGAGVIFPCTGESPRARLTNVTEWENGYNADPVIADETFDPADDWRLYRLELRGGQLMLAIDGEMVVSGTADPGISSSVTDTEAGLWSQGVGLEVRRLSVYALPPE